MISPAGSVLLTMPVNVVDPNPAATNPKLPKEEFELVKSHCAPLDA